MTAPADLHKRLSCLRSGPIAEESLTQAMHLAVDLFAARHHSRHELTENIVRFAGAIEAGRKDPRFLEVASTAFEALKVGHLQRLGSREPILRNGPHGH